MKNERKHFDFISLLNVFMYDSTCMLDCVFLFVCYVSFLFITIASWMRFDRLSVCLFFSYPSSSPFSSSSFIRSSGTSLCFFFDFFISLFLLSFEFFSQTFAIIPVHLPMFLLTRRVAVSC
jgi:hypothetical protein